MRPHEEMGFTTVQDAIVAMLMRGDKATQIVAALGCKRNTVYKINSKLKASDDGVILPPPPAKVEVSPDNMLVMSVFGSRRKISASDVANRVLDAAVSKGIAEGLLDHWETLQQARLARRHGLCGGEDQYVRPSDI